MNKLQLKRVYEESSKTDDYRILVDRIWPRGVNKFKVKIDLWLKEIAPSNELRKWFAHDTKKRNKFRTKYSKELKNKNKELNIITQRLKKSNVTLLFGAKDEKHNQAVTLQEYFRNKLADD